MTQQEFEGLPEEKQNQTVAEAMGLHIYESDWVSEIEKLHPPSDIYSDYIHSSQGLKEMLEWVLKSKCKLVFFARMEDEIQSVDLHDKEHRVFSGDNKSLNLALMLAILKSKGIIN